MRFGLAFLGAFLLTASVAAELPESATLDEVFALATRPDRPVQENGYDTDRYKALQRLQEWPQTSDEDETRIVAAFQQALCSTNGVLRDAGASGLGYRGHGEVIPRILELSKKDPNLLGCFFQPYTSGRKVEPPTKRLRLGLRSKNPDFRRGILGVIAACQAVGLRVEVEKVLASDPSDWTRNEAARTLMQLKCSESLPALRRALTAKSPQEGVVYALTQLGGDSDVAAVLPLLQSKRENLRGAVAAGLSSAKLVNPRPACDALLATLHDPSDEVRFASIGALVHFREGRTIPAIRELLTHPPRPISWDDAEAYVEAISTIGGPEAIKLLDDMVGMGFHNRVDLNRALARFGSPSSGRAVWEAYVRDPIREPVDFHGMFEEVASVLVACADAELLTQIRERLGTSDDPKEKLILGDAVTQIQERLKQKASIPST